MLPGWRQSAAHWQPAARWLSRDRISLVSENLGAMAETCMSERGSVDRLAEMSQKLSERAIEEGASVIVGHSAGAPLAVLTAAQVPEIRCVVLVEPVGAHFLPNLNHVQRKSYDRLAEVTATTKGSEYPLAKGDTLRSIELRSLIDANHSAETVGLPSVNAERATVIANGLTALTTPTLMIRGQVSGIVSIEDIETLAAFNGNVKTIEIPLAGHSPHIDRPRQTTDAMLQFEAATYQNYCERI
ncbi:hypothetical protein EA58_15600 [Photobacterium galatheae]|uniref:AB hydrolase-1 domain-containing protein n=1 Tax=Photobacterium galatheae TaxID=1654360 RepID=A0A066RKE9_9GAMM|nr:hypothetical protein EA58_15600 [Photobacterium galatheae]